MTNKTSKNNNHERALTPREKAKEIIEKIAFLSIPWSDLRKSLTNPEEIAFFVCDELIKETKSKYWYDVKKELKKLL